MPSSPLQHAGSRAVLAALGVAMIAAGVAMSFVEGRCGLRPLLIGPAAGLSIVLAAHRWMTDGELCRYAMAIGLIWLWVGWYIAATHAGGGGGTISLTNR